MTKVCGWSVTDDQLLAGQSFGSVTSVVSIVLTVAVDSVVRVTIVEPHVLPWRINVTLLQQNHVTESIAAAQMEASRFLTCQELQYINPENVVF